MLNSMISKRGRKDRFFVFSVAMIILAVALGSRVPPAHAMPATATPCTTTDCSVSPVISNAFANGFGNVASEAKVDYVSAYYDGGKTVYGGYKPSIYIALMARLSNTPRMIPNPLYNLRTLSVSVTITDSSGNVFSPQPYDGHAPVSTTFWTSPSSSGVTDSSGALTDLAAWFLDHSGIPYPNLPNLVNPQLQNGVTLTSTSIVAQWTAYGFNFPDNTYRGGYFDPTLDKSVEVNIVPQFVKPDVYTISVSTHSEQGECDQNTYNPYWFVCSTDDTQTQSYSFNYVYEADAGTDGDADVGTSTARSLAAHGSYNGLLYGIDTDDYYGFQVNQGKKLQFAETPLPSADFSLTVYDNTGTRIGSTQDSGTGATTGIAFTAS